MTPDEFGASILRPKRPSLDAVTAMVGGAKSAREAWETLAARGHLPFEMVEDPSRRFTASSERAKGPWRSHPATVDDVIAFASDLAGVARAEALAREFVVRLIASHSAQIEELAEMGASGEVEFLKREREVFRKRAHVIKWSFRPVDVTLDGVLDRSVSEEPPKLVPLDLTFEESARKEIEVATVLKASGYRSPLVPSARLGETTFAKGTFDAVTDLETRAILASIDYLEELDEYDWHAWWAAEAFVWRRAKWFAGSHAEAYVSICETGYLLDTVDARGIFLRAPPRAPWAPMESRQPKSLRRTRARK